MVDFQSLLQKADLLNSNNNTYHHPGICKNLFHIKLFIKFDKNLSLNSMAVLYDMYVVYDERLDRFKLP